MEMTRNCRLTEYVLAIKTEPHRGWQYPDGWGPYYTRSDAERARERADELWMSARVTPRVTDARLTDEQIRDLRALGCVVAVCGAQPGVV